MYKYFESYEEYREYLKGNKFIKPDAITPPEEPVMEVKEVGNVSPKVDDKSTSEPDESPEVE